MSIENLFAPFIVFFDWFRTFEISIGEFTFTFMDIYVWCGLALVCIWFIKRLID